jgi:hypothetical protein
MYRVIVYHSPRMQMMRGASDPLVFLEALRMKRYLDGLGYQCRVLPDCDELADQCAHLARTQPQSFVRLRVPGHKEQCGVAL